MKLQIWNAIWFTYTWSARFDGFSTLLSLLPPILLQSNHRCRCQTVVQTDSCTSSPLLNFDYLEAHTSLLASHNDAFSKIKEAQNMTLCERTDLWKPQIQHCRTTPVQNEYNGHIVKYLVLKDQGYFFFRCCCYPSVIYWLEQGSPTLGCSPLPGRVLFKTGPQERWASAGVKLHSHGTHANPSLVWVEGPPLMWALCTCICPLLAWVDFHMRACPYLPRLSFE